MLTAGDSYFNKFSNHLVYLLFLLSFIHILVTAQKVLKGYFLTTSAVCELEIKAILKKFGFQQVPPVQNQLLSNFFLVSRKDGGHRSVRNLKHLPPFQDGRLTSFEKKCYTQMYMQVRMKVRTKGYILLHSNGREFKIVPFSVPVI